MAAAEGVPATDADGAGDAADDVEAEVVRGLVQVQDRDAGADLECRAPVARGPVRVAGPEVSDVPEVVRPDGERPGAGGLGVEVVTRVLDDQSEVEVPREVDGQLHLRDVGGPDHVGRHPAKSARGVGPGDGRRHAAHPLEDGVAEAQGLGRPSPELISGIIRSRKTGNLLILGRRPLGRHVVALCLVIKLRPVRITYSCGWLALCDG